MEQVEEAIGGERHPFELKVPKEELTARDEVLKGGTTGAAVTRLEDAGLVHRLNGGELAAVDTGADVHQIAERAVQDQEAYRAYRLGRGELIKDDAETSDCRRWTVMNYFGEPI